MDRERVYYATRRPSRLRDQFARQSPDRTADTVRTNYGYRRGAVEDYGALVTSYREVGKRPYGTRYQSYVAEDSYARPYDRIYSYPRRTAYNEVYTEYNTRSRGYVAMEPPFTGTRYKETTAAKQTNRTTTRSRSSYRTPVESDRVTRKTMARWNEALETQKDTLPTTKGKMQLRYSVKRTAETVAEKKLVRANSKAAAQAAPTERLVRARHQSPRKPKGEAATVKQYQEVAPARKTAEKKTDSNSSASSSQLKKEEVPTQASQEEMTLEKLLSSEIIDSAEIDATPMKKKRGRPKGTKAAVKKTTTVKRRRKADAVEIESDDQLPTVSVTPAKRASARTKKSATTPLNAARSAESHTANEMKKQSSVAALPVTGNAEEHNSVAKTQASTPVISFDNFMNNKDSKTTSAEEDSNDLDYEPERPSAGKIKARKGRATAATKTTTPMRVPKTKAKPKTPKRSKEEAEPLVEVVEPPKVTEVPPKPVVPIEAEVQVVNDGPGSAKMLFFEEYLDMSERMYCGAPLCVRSVEQGIFPGASVPLTEKEEIKVDEPTKLKQEMKNEVEIAEAKVEGGSKSSKQNNSEAPARKPEAVVAEEDPLFEFHCSNLELRFRVAFAMLTSDVRQSQMIDLWGPKELVLFELGMFKHGKEFHEIQRIIPTKTVQEIVDMYYFWKKTNRYKLWKANRQY